MNNFRIYFKETTVLDINGSKKTFIKGTSWGFKFISDKDLKNIRKQVLKSNTMVFKLTDDFTGCSQVLYGNKQPKDITVDNLITLNRGKKSKNKPKYSKTKSISITNEENIENVVKDVPLTTDDNIIVSDEKLENEEM